MTMLVSAKLMISGSTVGAGTHLGDTYKVSANHVDFVGDIVQIIAGPHKDFEEPDVYTVKLLNPPTTMSDMPFFNSGNGCAWEHVTINVASKHVAKM